MGMEYNAHYSLWDTEYSDAMRILEGTWHLTMWSFVWMLSVFEIKVIFILLKNSLTFVGQIQPYYVILWGVAWVTQMSWCWAPVFCCDFLWISPSPRPVVFKMWFLGQQHQYHMRMCKNAHFLQMAQHSVLREIPGDSDTCLTVESHCPKPVIPALCSTMDVQMNHIFRCWTIAFCHNIPWGSWGKSTPGSYSFFRR